VPHFIRDIVRCLALVCLFISIRTGAKQRLNNSLFVSAHSHVKRSETGIIRYVRVRASTQQRFYDRQMTTSRRI